MMAHMNDFVDLNASFGTAAEPFEPETPDLTVKAEKLQDLDLEHELLAQYKRATKLLNDIEYGSDIPLAQKASALNSITTILANITKTQTDLYNMERLKKLEAVLIDVLREFPEVQAQFMANYKARLDVL